MCFLHFIPQQFSNTDHLKKLNNDIFNVVKHNKLVQVKAKIKINNNNNNKQLLPYQPLLFSLLKLKTALCLLYCYLEHSLVSPPVQQAAGVRASTWRLTCQRTSPWLKRHHVVFVGDWRGKMAAPEEQELSQAQTEKLLQFQVASASFSV